MDDKLYSEAMTTLDMDMEMFELVANSIKTESPAYTIDDYKDFYNILKSKSNYSDTELRYIIKSKLGFITTMVAVWAQVCEDTNRNIDKNEFCNTFFTQYSGE